MKILLSKIFCKFNFHSWGSKYEVGYGDCVQDCKHKHCNAELWNNKKIEYGITKHE